MPKPVLLPKPVPPSQSKSQLLLPRMPSGFPMMGPMFFPGMPFPFMPMMPPPSGSGNPSKPASAAALKSMQMQAMAAATAAAASMAKKNGSVPTASKPLSTSSTTQNRKRPRLTEEERLERARERNRIHARKTRQRKKEMLNSLQEKLKALSEHGTKLRQDINERKTASILLNMAMPDREIPDLPVPIEFNADECEEGTLMSSPQLRSVGRRCKVEDEIDYEDEEDEEAPAGGGGEDEEEVDEEDTDTDNSVDLGDDEESEERSRKRHRPQGTVSFDEACPADVLAAAAMLRYNTRGKGQGRGWEPKKEKGGSSGGARRTKFPINVPADDGKDIPSQVGSGADLEAVRRERNRMHAKQTRLRKKQLVEDTKRMIERLEAQNKQLTAYAAELDSLASPGVSKPRLAGPKPVPGLYGSVPSAEAAAAISMCSL